MCCLFVMQTTAYELRISDWSSDVCSSNLYKCRAIDPVPCPAETRRRRSSRPHRHERLAHQARDTKIASLACAQRLADRKSVVQGKSVSVRVDCGGRRVHNTTTR